MKTWLSKISANQKKWLAGTLLVCILIVITGMALEPAQKKETDVSFSIEMNIKEIAGKLAVTGKSFARDLELAIDVSKIKPLKDLKVTQEDLEHAVEHVLGHRATGLKYYVFAALVVFGMVFLIRLGRPDHNTVSERKLWYPQIPYLLALVVAVGTCGFMLGKSPNPMEGTVKVFKAMVGLYPSVSAKVLSFGFFLAMAVVGTCITHLITVTHCKQIG